MKNSFRRFLGLLGVLLALSSSAAFALTPGQTLSADQIAQLGKLPVYDIGESRVRVIPSQSNGGITLLLNAQGLVGSSRNEVAISEAPADRVQTVLRQTLPQPQSVQTYEPTGITVARYADFAQAIEGLHALKAALPDAQVSLSVRFGKKVPY